VRKQRSRSAAFSDLHAGGRTRTRTGEAHGFFQGGRTAKSTLPDARHAGIPSLRGRRRSGRLRRQPSKNRHTLVQWVDAIRVLRCFGARFPIVDANFPLSADDHELRVRDARRCSTTFVGRAKIRSGPSWEAHPMIDKILRSLRSIVALGVLMLVSVPAWAANEVYESTCGPSYPCVKPPKENLCFRQYGDLGANGEIGQAIGALSKGQKKTILKIDMTFEWFSLSAQYRPFNLKVNNKFPVNFLILNHLDSCPSGFCLRHATFYYDMDQQESVYPGQFVGQPLVITLDSAKLADASSQYNVTICAQVLKNK
jgi:hypothetical protein